MQRFYIGIDGLSGTGKTTLAARLAEELDAEIIHTDDFYLPMDERTKSRTSSPGWTIDYERFSREVAKPAISGNPISYGVFNCQSQKIDHTVSLPECRFVIVEGCYALHPEIPDFYDLRVTLKANQTKCEERLLARDGEALLARFRSEWLPLEHEYLDCYMIAEFSDIVLETD